MDILFVNACPRQNSRTKRLADYLLTQLRGSVHERNLAAATLLPLTEETLTLRATLAGQGDFAHPLFQPAKEFAAADVIVVAAPFWDLSFPALLKLYIEHINIVGLTFAYHTNGRPYGLCKAQKLYYITTSGGPILNEAYGYGYLQALAKDFYGISETYCIKAENLDIENADEAHILRQAKDQIDALLNA